MHKPTIPAILLAGLLAGCAATGSDGTAGGGVQQAVSRQTPTSEAERRARVHTELGMLYLQEGRYEVALDEARAAVAADSRYAPAHNLFGQIYMALGQNASAERSFREALGLAGGDPEINNDYGWFLCRTGKPRESLDHFRNAFGNPLYQNPGRALINAGYCAILAKDDRQAEEYLLRALRVDRASPAALYWLADISYRGKRYADARQRMSELHARTEPNAPTAWLALRIERKLGDRGGEARFTGILRSKFRDSDEYMKMSRGEFD